VLARVVEGGTALRKPVILGLLLSLALAAPASADFTFVHITDLHMTPAKPSAKLSRTEWAKQGQDRQWDKARQAICDRINEVKPDFVLVTGDLTQDGQNPEYQRLVEWSRQIKAPVYWIPGNHDVGKNLRPTAGSERSLRNYERIFGRSYLSFGYQNAYFILANSMLAVGEIQGAQKALAAQSDWFAQQCRYAASAGFPFVFVLQHYQPARDPSLMKAAQRSGASAVLFGHIHKYTAAVRNGMTEISGTSVKGIQNNKLGTPGYAVVKVGDSQATYQFYDTAGKPVFQPVVIPARSAGQSDLWRTLTGQTSTLPKPSPDSLLSNP